MDSVSLEWRWGNDDWLSNTNGNMMYCMRSNICRFNTRSKRKIDKQPLKEATVAKKSKRLVGNVGLLYTRVLRKVGEPLYPIICFVNEQQKINWTDKGSIG